jgi:hypothetical protein
MHSSVRTTSALCAALIVLLLACATAQASPITVNLRVEGSSATLFEGAISSQGESFQAASSNGAHPCNYAENGTPGGFADEGNQSATPTTALHDAALGAGLAFDATWFGSGAGKNENPGDFFVTTVGSDANQSVSPFASWGFAVNYTTAPVGGCQIALAPGNEVLWAYNYFNLSHLLRLAGPDTAAAGSPLTVHVTDGQNGAAIEGAAIGEDIAGVTSAIPGAVTDAAGNATVTLAHAGQVLLKATRADSVRSNGLAVCIHAGNDGTCGTSLPGAPAGPGAQPAVIPPGVADSAVAEGALSGHVYARRLAPRVLRGIVRVPQGGTLREVRIRLERRYGRRCFAFSGARERFVRTRCGAARLFSVGSSESFSYLLPAALPPGRYVYDVVAIDGAGHASPLRNGISHIVFRVR